MIRALIAVLSLLFSLNVFAAPLCAPISETSCASYPEQAQIIAKVVATEGSVVDGQNVCAVSIAPRYFSNHALCPMNEEENLQYVTCGACPEVGTEVSGVLVKDASGIVRLD